MAGIFEIGVRQELEAAHSLKGPKFGDAARIHGHTYKIEAKVSGKELDSDGVLHDIVSLRTSLGSVLQSLHYSNLDDITELQGINTTAEELARFIHNGVKKNIPRGSTVEVLTVTVWENDEAFASYSGSV